MTDPKHIDPGMMLLRDLVAVYAATWREGVPMLLPFVAVAVGMWL